MVNQLSRKKIIISICVVLVAAGTYCKLDLCEIVKASYEPITTATGIPKLEAYPYLLANDRRLGKTPLLLSCRVVESGPLSLRVAFRDFGKTLLKVRIVSVSLASESRQWHLRLRTPPPYYQSWRALESQSGTNDFDETWFFAVKEDSGDEAYAGGDIVPPSGLQRIYVDLVFDVQGKSKTTRTISQRFVLRPEGTGYFSALFAKMISA